jgi:small subunit ribosomal protein S4e
MVRGPKKHLKLLNTPSSWLLHKLDGIYAPRPSPGPHKLRESLPLVIILRNRLKYALTRREVIVIAARRQVKIDGKVRTDPNFPVGFMDVVSLEKVGENFRLMYDTKGHFVLHRIDQKEAGFKLLRVQDVSLGKKATIGTNPFANGRAAVVPYIVTNDGRTIRYPDPHIHKNDTVKFDLKTGKIVDHVKFDLGHLAIITKGANVGRVGVIVARDRHVAASDIVHLKDRRGHTFATRLENVFVIGGSNQQPLISLPKTKGVKLSVIEEAQLRAKKASESSKKKKKKAVKKQ